jgi:hypothetical protein
MPTSGRRRGQSTRRADALFGILIPAFFILLASYQEIKQGHVDKYTQGCLLVFGLGALGWRIDAGFERYLESRAGIRKDRDEHDGE